MLDRATLQTLTTKLDQNAISLAEAKKFVKTSYGKDVKGATRDQFIRNLAKEIDGAAQPSQNGFLFGAPMPTHAFKVRVIDGQGEGHVTYSVDAADRAEAFKAMLARLDESGSLPYLIALEYLGTK